MLVDVTTPEAGSAIDNVAGEPDVQYSSEAASASVSWKDFYDPESGVESYIIEYLRKHQGAKNNLIYRFETKKLRLIINQYLKQ